MGVAKDALMQAQAQLWERIDQLSANLPQVTVSRLAHEIDELRRIAGEHGLAPVVEIAHRLESELAVSPGRPTIASFLEAMRDAVGCNRLDPTATQAYLAAVNQRLYG